MKRILCVVGGEMNSVLEQCVLQYDTEDYEIHLYDHMAEETVVPSDILGCLDNISYEDEEMVPCVFMSDIPNLFEVIYRLYHQVFSDFALITYEGQKECAFEGDDLYQAILHCPLKDEEHLYKPIYSNGEILLWDAISVKPLDGTAFKEIDKAPVANYHKVYTFRGVLHIFEPVYGRSVNIALDNSQGQQTMYYYPFLQPQITQIKEWADSKTYEDHIVDLQSMFEMVCDQQRQVGIYQYYMFLIALRHLLSEYGNEQFFLKLHCLSFLVKMTGDEDTLNHFMETVLDIKDRLLGHHFYYISQQMKRWHLENKNLRGSAQLSQTIYQEAFSFYKNQLGDLLTPIPKEERREDVIVVFTIQFLTEKHAPTRTALERIYTLGKELNKKVYVVNTREQYSEKGKLPLYNIFAGNVLDVYNLKSEFTWKDYTFDFYQCPCPMPDLDEMGKVVRWLRNIKPYAIMTIGNGSILSDVCAEMIPVMGVPVTFSTIPKKDNQFTIVGRYIPDEEKKDLARMGYDVDRIVESVFTFDLKPQKTQLTREELGLPKDRFLLGVVGIRLDYEVDAAFLQAMEQTLTWNTHLVFAGRFAQYEKLCEENSWLKEHSSFVGFQEDILAFMELIDLYVNPMRLGGGFSIIEAFYKERPGVTIGYGDVAAAAGPEFCVKNYDEMVKEIQHYIQDATYYDEQVQKGILRAQKMTDSKVALEDILNEVQTRKAFF